MLEVSSSFRGVFGISKSFGAKENVLTSRKKLGKGALDYLQSHPFCKKETLGS